MTTGAGFIRAAVFDGDGVHVVDDLWVRAPRRGEVMVEIDAAGLCQSDLNPIKGHYAQRVPAVLGHEAAGRIVAVGEHTALPVGTSVVLSPLLACGQCRACRAHRPSICLDVPRRDPTPVFRRGGPAGETVHQFVNLGAFAARTIVAEDQVIPVPSALPVAAAAMLGCAVITGSGAVARGMLEAGEVLLVTGVGGIGLNAIQEGHYRRARVIVAVDRNPAKEAIARQLGASAFVVPGAGESLGDALARVGVAGVDVHIECTGSVALLEAGVTVLAPGGRVVIVGLPGPADTMTVPVRALFRDQAILGCRMGSIDPHRAIPQLVHRYEAGALELEAIISRVVDLTAIGALIEDLERGRLDRGILRVAPSGS